MADLPNVDSIEKQWRVRDTVAILGLLAWGAAWTGFALVQLANGPVVERRTLLDVFCLSVGLAGLYVGLGAAGMRLWELGSQSRRS
jgi:hypothetical protein